MSRRGYRKYPLLVRTRSGLLFVQATLTSRERKTVWLLFDTGATYCGLVRDVAALLRLEAQGQVAIGGIQGDQDAEIAVIDSVALAVRVAQNDSDEPDPVVASEIQFVILEANWSQWLRRQGVSGLLGANFIKAYGFYVNSSENALQVVMPIRGQ